VDWGNAKSLVESRGSGQRQPNKAKGKMVSEIHGAFLDANEFDGK
jgi:hypothetical protein